MTCCLLLATRLTCTWTGGGTASMACMTRAEVAATYVKPILKLQHIIGACRSDADVPTFDDARRADSDVGRLTELPSVGGMDAWPPCEVTRTSMRL